METAIKCLENSYRKPQEIMSEKNDTMIITKVKKHKTLEERVKESGIPLKAYLEINWGEPSGDEVW